MTRKLIPSLVLILALIGGCQPAPSAEDLPPLPPIDLNGFVPSVAEQIQEAIDAVVANPTDVEANGELGLTLGTYNFTEAALVAYSRATMLAPREGRWAYAYGHMLGWSGDPEAAIAVLEPALERDRNNFWLGVELADQYLAVGRFDDSVTLFTQLAQRYPDRFQAHFGLGRAQLRHDNVEAAAAALSRAAQLQEGVGEIHFALGSAYRQLGEGDKAAQQFELAARYEDGKVDKFSPIMRKMASLDRGAKPLLTKARQLFEQNRFPEAIEAVEQALVIDPSRQDANAHLVLMYGRTGQNDKASEQYARALAAGADDALLHLNMGMVLRRSGQTRRARDVLALAVAADEGMANAHAELGLVDMQLGNEAQAVEHLEAAVKLDPAHQNANFALGNYFAERGDNERAVAHLEAAVAVETAATPAFLRTLAGIYTRLDRHSRAVDALTRARTLLARSGSAQTTRGGALKQAIEQDLEAARDAALASTGSASEG